MTKSTLLASVVLGLAAIGCAADATPARTTSRAAPAAAVTTAIACEDPTECAVGTFCADGYCCNTVCSGPAEACNVTGKEGTCSPIDIMTDPHHCGGKGQQCPPTAVCLAGHCDCPGTTTECGDLCVNEDSDPNHCGDCDTVCGLGQICRAGMCTAP